MRLVVMGRDLGSASGWDEVGDNILYFYDVELPDGSSRFDISFDHEKGIIELYTDNGKEVYETHDAIEYLSRFDKTVYEKD